MSKCVLDVCCGGRMFWFDKQQPNTIFMDNREFEEQLSNGQHLVVKPDIKGDFRNIPFGDNTFNIVVFDPPHLLKAGINSWLAKKYGRLNPATYKEDISKGFSECFRVLKINGVLIFKWNEQDVKTSEIIKLAPCNPLFGHKSGRLSKTQWLVFMKGAIQ